MEPLLKVDLYLNGWVRAFDVKAETRRWTIVEQKYPSEEIRGIPERSAGPPDHLHGVVLETLVLVIIVITSKEQTIISHLRGTLCVSVFPLILVH